MQLPLLEKLPHALVITGNRQANFEVVKKYIAAAEDVYIFDQESLKIDQLRDEIIAFLSKQKLAQQRFVVISTDQFGVEAQNAFLKNLEEPEVGTHIILLINDEKKLLSTILSRAQVFYGERSVGESRLDINEFVKKNLGAKFEYVETWTKAKKDEDNVSKSEVLSFIDHLERYLWDKGERSNDIFSDIRQMREYAAIRGASHRIILDYLAIMLS